jgi:LysM repeat protein
MSEQPTAPVSARPARRENVFTHKIGPLPMWGWVAIIGGILVAWRMYSSKQSAAAANTSATGNANTVPQFVNQTYTTVTAPSAAAGTPAGTAPPTPGTGGTPVASKPTTEPKPVHSIPAVAPSGPAPRAQYTVKPGDTLAGVAKKYGLTVAELAHANVYVPGEVPGNLKVGKPLGTGAGLKTGQVLTIP